MSSESGWRKNKIMGNLVNNTNHRKLKSQLDFALPWKLQFVALAGPAFGDRITLPIIDFQVIQTTHFWFKPRLSSKTCFWLQKTCNQTSTFFLLAFLPSTHPIYIFLNTTNFIGNTLVRSQEEIGKREKSYKDAVKAENQQKHLWPKNYSRASHPSQIPQATSH